MSFPKPQLLHIAAGLDLPIEAVTQTFAILGVRGSGKTTSAIVLAEEMLTAGAQVVFLDPLGVSWGLKSSKDGTHAAYSIPVLGGHYGDLPLGVDSGEAVAEFLVETGSSAVLSMRHFNMSEQRRFATAFGQKLYDLKGEIANRSPLHLVIDEADHFVMQRIPKGYEMMFHVYDRIIRFGRVSGIGATLISQRPQVISKDVLSQVETLICMRLLHKRDRDAVKDWIEANDTAGHQEEFMASLASLGRGEAWIWSPSWLDLFRRVQIRDRRTFDSSSTPKAGEKPREPKQLAPVDLEQLRERMATAITEIENNDPVLLKKRVQQLERKIEEMQLKPAAVPPEVLEQERRKARQELGKQFLEEMNQFQTRISALIQLPPPTPVSVAAVVASIQQKVTETRQEAKSMPANATGNLPSGERQLLIGIVQHGGRLVTRPKLSAMTGYKTTTRNTYIQRLQAKGLIEVGSEGIVPTHRAALALGTYEDLLTGVRLQEFWISQLPSGEASILKMIRDAHPHPVLRSSISEQLGFATTTRNTYIQRLVARFLLVAYLNSSVRLAPEVL